MVNKRLNEFQLHGTSLRNQYDVEKKVFLIKKKEQVKLVHTSSPTLGPTFPVLAELPLV